MGNLMHGEGSEPALFLAKRLIRILPLYWICTLTALVVYFLKPGILYEFDPSLNNLMQSLLFIPHRAALPESAPTLMQGWTLEYEMFFYVLCTVCLALFRKQPVLALSFYFGHFRRSWRLGTPRGKSARNLHLPSPDRALRWTRSVGGMAAASLAKNCRARLGPDHLRPGDIYC
jgi:peptidoglycan/LPS O-acetylase OafA/YrhL